MTAPTPEIFVTVVAAVCVMAAFLMVVLAHRK